MYIPIYLIFFLSQLNSRRRETRRSHEVALVALVAATERPSNNAADNRVTSVRTPDLSMASARDAVDESDSLAT